ncbi:F-box protein CPR1-like [Solanum stenotomum]|uniref:F-box protein CPR1-like n=1 Tax=Solanum stenotomum TaxID=172797 RepID=UPI0020D099E4|nr:F-box protein CPR1-like [Solanum stenotomum]
MEEILVNILSRLPVKSVVRFNCVSKFWNILISHPYFRKKHLNHAKNHARSQKLLSLDCLNNADDNNCLHFYSYSLSLVQLVKDIRVVDCPSNSNAEGTEVYCSCDGLFLIGIWTEPHVAQPSLLMIWNPSTRESIVLPHSKFNNDDDDGDEFRSTYGLGYDSISDDYKVFRLVMTKDGQNKNEIFALKNNSWRIIEETSSLDWTDCSMYSGGEFLPFVDGAFHWLGISSKLSAVSFNISFEVYRDIPLPEIVCYLTLSRFEYDVKIEVDVGLTVLAGMLGLYYKDDNFFNLWVMEDKHGSFWMKLFTIPSYGIYKVIPTYTFSDYQMLLCFQLDSTTRSRFVYRIISVGSFGLDNQIWPLDHDAKDGIVYTESLIFPKLGQ